MNCNEFNATYAEVLRIGLSEKSVEVIKLLGEVTGVSIRL